MIRHRWGFLYSILALVILATVLIVWWDFVNPSEEAANQSPQGFPEYTVEYQDDEADCYVAGGDGSNDAGIGTCYDVYMKPTADEKLLARVTRYVVLGGNSEGSYVVRVYFHDPGGSSSPYATAFHFGNKEEVPPCVTLGREQLDSATVSDGIYVLRGDVPGEGEGTTC